LSQGIGVYFFNVNIPRKTAYFEEKIHREVEEVEEVFVLRSFFLFLFRLFRLRGYNFSRNLVVFRNLKVNADALPLPLILHHKWCKIMIWQNIVVLTNIFEKHTAAVPEPETILAKSYRTDFLSRYSEKDVKQEE
jgi:hypothetical protein